MDTSAEFLYGSICTGYGGGELGLRLAMPNSRCIVACEIEAYAIALLEARMRQGLLDDCPIWSDIATFDGKPWRGVLDMLYASYPCQPFSVAGKRLGSEDPRHLWPHIARVIREVEPPFVFLENVANHLVLGFADVRAELQGMGYRVEAGLFSASEVGAPHRRKRLFVLAYNDKCAVEAGTERTGWETRTDAGGRRAESGLADSDDSRGIQPQGSVEEQRGWLGDGSQSMADSQSGTRLRETQGRTGHITFVGEELGNSESNDERRERGASRGFEGADRRSSGDVGNPESNQRRSEFEQGEQERRRTEFTGTSNGHVADAQCPERRESEPSGHVADRQTCGRAQAASGTGESGAGPMGNAGSAGLQGRELIETHNGNRGGQTAYGSVEQPGRTRIPLFPPGPNARDEWARILEARPDFAPAIERHVRGMADGLVNKLDGSARVDRLRACGNGIVPLQCALAFTTLAWKFGEE